jgi:hypothetical protein
MTRALSKAAEKRDRRWQNGFRPFQMRLMGVLFLWIARVQAQDSQCTSQDLDAYIQCVSNNPCTCSNCDPNPVDNTPVINVDTPPQDCRDVNRIFCPLIRCCSTCEDLARFWYECPFQAFALETLGVECSATCDGYNNGDVDGECAPTVSPAPSLVPTDLPITVSVNSSARPSISSNQRSSDFPSNSPSFANLVGGDSSALPTSGIYHQVKSLRFRCVFYGTLLALHLL